MFRLIYALTLLLTLPLFCSNEEPGNESRVNTFRNENEQTLFNRYRDRGAQYRLTRRKMYLIKQREKQKEAKLALIKEKKLMAQGNNSQNGQLPEKELETSEQQVHVPEIQNMDGRAHNPNHLHHHVPEVEEHFPVKEKYNQISPTKDIDTTSSEELEDSKS